jgi:hypothetical protein
MGAAESFGAEPKPTIAKALYAIACMGLLGKTHFPSKARPSEQVAKA